MHYSDKVNQGGKEGYWYEVKFAHRKEKVLEGEDEHNGVVRSWKEQTALVHPWPTWVFVPAFHIYSPVLVHPSRTTVHLKAKDGKEIVRQVENMRYHYYPPSLPGQRVPEQYQDIANPGKPNNESRTIPVDQEAVVDKQGVIDEAVLYPKVDEVGGVKGHWHLVQLPTVMIEVMKGEGEIEEGELRSWPHQQVVGQFPRVKKFVPFQRVYHAVSMKAPPEVNVMIHLNPTGGLFDRRIWATSMDTPGHLKFMFFPTPIDGQIIPNDVKEILAKKQKGQHAFDDSRGVIYRSIANVVEIPDTV